jgi:UDP-glucose 4-epimerase
MVTGGAGFIGGHITEFLLDMGHEVVVFDNFSTGSMENLAAVRDKAEVVNGDIRDIGSLDAAMDGVDYVIHHAAEISVVKSVEEPDFVNEVNVGGTMNVLVSARKHKVKRITFASSSAIYGDTSDRAQSEEMLPNPLSPYGASKMAAEHYLSCFYQLYGLETVRLRYFNVYGPRQNPKSQYAAVIPKFIDRILHGQDLHIYGDGEQTRDFVYVKDIARANYLACTADCAAGKVINIATQQSYSVNELAQMLIKMAGKEVEVVHDPPLAGEIKYSASNIELAKDLLDYDPLFDFADGLRLTFEYFAAKAGAL